MGCKALLRATMLAMLVPLVVADEAEPFRILHVMSYHADWEWNIDQFQGFKDALDGVNVEYRVFEMDTKRSGTASSKFAKAEDARALIEAWRPDLVYVNDDDAQQYATRQFVGSDIPFVFSGVNADPAEYGLTGSPNVTGVLEQEHVVEIESLESLDVAARVASQLITMLAEPVTVAGHEMIMTVSIGISIFPDDGDDLATVMRNADAAMYRVKAAGKNSYQFYSDDMRVAGLERLRRETELRRAVPNGELELRYQPVVSVATREITGVEALIRWQHPRLGLLAPSQFLPIAEESGLIVPIGLWAIQRSCIDGARLQALSGRPFRMAVNVSGTQLREPQFPVSVAKALAASGLSPESLELEITEHTLLKDLISVRRSLEALRIEGVRFSIDDFGTGYSSLIHIKHLPVVRLKVDQSFVRDVTIDPDDRAIVAAVIALAESLGLGVVAEGVESADQIELLARLVCPEVQGFLCGKPMSLSQISVLLSSRRETAEPSGDRAVGP